MPFRSGRTPSQLRRSRWTLLLRSVNRQTVGDTVVALVTNGGEVMSRAVSLSAIKKAVLDGIVDAAGAAGEVAKLSGNAVWEGLRAVRAGRVAAVDANGCFSRPGPRLIDGIEELFRLFSADAAARPRS